MRRIFTLAAILAATSTAFAGRTIRVSGPHFSFLVAEPADWTIDFQSAAQVAHFVVSPGGLDWRSSDVVIFGRFVPTGEEESLDDFVGEDEKRFREQCPTAQISGMDVDLRSPFEFHFVSYRCPGTRSDLVAVTQVPGYFAVFILSAQRGGGVRPEMAAFREVLESFQWLGKETRRNPPRRSP